MNELNNETDSGNPMRSPFRLKTATKLKLAGVAVAGVAVAIILSLLGLILFPIALIVLLVVAGVLYLRLHTGHHDDTRF